MRLERRYPYIRPVMVVSLLLGVGMLVLLHSDVFAGETVILASEEPPASFADADGVPAGFAVDLVRRLMVCEEGDADIRIMPEGRILAQAAKYPDVLFFGFSRTPGREKLYQWVMPIMRKEWVFYAHKNGFPPADDVKSLKGLRVGCKIGDVRCDYLHEQGFSHVVENSTHAGNIKMLARGRLDLMLYDPLGMAADCSRLGLSSSDFTPVLRLRGADVYVALSLSTPPETFRRWRECAQRLEEDGEAEAVAEKWHTWFRERYGLDLHVRDGMFTFR